MIHYNETWTRAVEGHPDVVVHGPLNLINMLDCWRDVHHPDGSGVPKSISYRALAPIYAGEDYAIKTSTSPSTVGNTMEVVIDKGGSVCMTGTITSLD
jgi:hydroxyacyl-ACP dehydratase HTD2-like protein with hotdog domain